MWPNAIESSRRAAHRWREPAPERVIDHLLERFPEAVDLLLDHPGHVRIQRQGCPHRVIMMLLTTIVKMPTVRRSELRLSSRPRRREDRPGRCSEAPLRVP